MKSKMILEDGYMDIPRIPENIEFFRPNDPIEDFCEEERKLLEEDFKANGCY